MTISPEAFMTQPPEPDEDETLLEIDRNARAYGFEIGKGQPLAEVIDQNSPDNPFMDPAWRDRVTATPTMAPYDPSPLDSIADSLRQLVELQEERNGWNRPRELTVNAPTAAEICAAESDGLSEVVVAAREAYDDLEAKYNALFKLLADVEKIIAPSTSKLANNVRAAITEWRNPEVPDPEPEADVELVHAVPTGGRAPCGVHYMEGTFGADPTCPECRAAEPPAGPVPVENAAEMEHAPPPVEADVEEWRAYARSLGYTGPDVDKANRSRIRTMLGIVQPVAEDEGATA